MKLLLFLLLVVAVGANAAYLFTPINKWESTDIGSPYIPPSAVSVPTIVPFSRVACTGDACDTVCEALGYNHGFCSSSIICHCYD
ncbi:unnamed protein product [Plutella xylostella]|uniref:(diamondback moth) hypothetical protein n=1 Tax=Plutella xylostella TaxID=51655 RepID=A0A8S4D7G7_PLUXY|nr:unnamed protein product [Plutella xylostella]